MRKDFTLIEDQWLVMGADRKPHGQGIGTLVKGVSILAGTGQCWMVNTGNKSSEVQGLPNWRVTLGGRQDPAETD